MFCLCKKTGAPIVKDNFPTRYEGGGNKMPTPSTVICSDWSPSFSLAYSTGKETGSRSAASAHFVFLLQKYKWASCSPVWFDILSFY